jgi:hypothetical protein
MVQDWLDENGTPAREIIAEFHLMIQRKAEAGR